MAKELAVTTKKVTDLQVVQGLTNLVRQVKEDLASSKAYFEANADFGADRFASVSFLSKNQRGQFIDHGNDKENLGKLYLNQRVGKFEVINHEKFVQENC